MPNEPSIEFNEGQELLSNHKGRTAIRWARAMLAPKNYGDGCNLYFLKHQMEADNGVYMTTREFSIVLSLAGYKKANESNWEDGYLIREDSLPYFRVLKGAGYDFKSVNGLALKAAVFLDTTGEFPGVSEILCKSIFEKGPGFFGERLRDAIWWDMADNSKESLNESTGRILRDCGLHMR